MIIKNALNYTGSKDRILPQLLENIDYSKETFIDFFCGSGVVGANVIDKFPRVVLNDGCWQIIELLKAIYTDKDFIKKVDDIIAEYKLSKTNKKEFLTLREVYNNEFSLDNNFNAPMLYALITHAINYFAIFNKSEGFSVPSGAGRSSFNTSIRKKLETFQKAIFNTTMEFYSFKMQQFIDIIKESYGSEDGNCLMVYFDSPYTVSDSSLSRSYGLNWDSEHDKKLFDFCDWLDSVGASFTLSNAFSNNDKENLLLKEWASKYKVIHVGEVDYSNCSYQRNKGKNKTDEVIIRNF